MILWRTTEGRCALLVAALAVALSVAGCQSEPTEPPDPAEYAHQLFVGANAERVEAGLEPLEWSDCIVPVAEERAQAVADSGQLEHDTLTAPCAEGATAGENLSLADETPQDIVDRWMASPGHAANILNPDFVDAAVACVPAGDKVACSWVAEGVSP